MTCRARWTRPVAALFALWFAFVIGDPGLLHACPMHGGHGAAHASTASHGAHDMAAMHGGNVTPGADASHDAPSHHGSSTQCSCVGMCCAATAVAAVPTVVAMHVPAVVARTEPVLRDALEPASAAPDTRLPFANGPPTA